MRFCHFKKSTAHSKPTGTQRPYFGSHAIGGMGAIAHLDCHVPQSQPGWAKTACEIERRLYFVDR